MNRPSGDQGKRRFRAETSHSLDADRPFQPDPKRALASVDRDDGPCREAVIYDGQEELTRG
jgi:hypothetical protein